MVYSWRYPNERYYDTWYTEFAQRDAATIADEELRGRITRRLDHNPVTRDEDVVVHVRDGAVRLEGEVHSVHAKRSAGDDCWDTEGVKDVRNDLQVVEE